MTDIEAQSTKTPEESNSIAAHFLNLLGIVNAGLEHQPDASKWDDDPATEAAAKASRDLYQMLGMNLSERKGNPDTLDEAYRQALFQADIDIRHALTWLLDMALSHVIQCEEDTHTLTVGISCQVEIQGSPNEYPFGSIAPLTAWLSKKLDVPEESVDISGHPYHPDECLEGIASYGNSVMRSKVRRVVQADNLERGEFERVVDEGEDAEICPMVFIATMHLASRDETIRVLNALLAQRTERDLATTLELPYSMPEGPSLAMVSRLNIELPFSALQDNAFDDVRKDIAVALHFLVAPDNYTMAELGIDFRVIARIDEDVPPYCTFEIYEVEGGIQLYEGSGKGTALALLPFFVDSMVDYALTLEFGEIAISKKVMRGLGARTQENTHAD